MAIEEELAALRGEIVKLTDITTALLKTRTEAIETIRQTAEPATKPAAATKTKPAEEPAAEPAAEAPAAITPDMVRAATEAYCKVDDPAERTARMAKVKEVLAKVGAATSKEVPEAKRKAYLNTIAKFVREGNVVQAEEAEEEI